MPTSRKNVKHEHGTVNPIIQQEEEIMIATVDKASAASGNAQIIGRNGELPLIQFLNRHLPYTIRAHTGHFVTPAGTLSPQLDVVLVDARYPLLAQNTDGSVLVMLHSVLTTIEVKTRATSADMTKALDNARIIHDLGSQMEDGGKTAFYIYTTLFCYRLRHRLSTIGRKYAEVESPETNPLDTYVLRVPDADCPAGVMVGAWLHFEPLERLGTEFEGKWAPFCMLQYNPLSDLYYRMMQTMYYFGLAAREFSFEEIGDHFNKYMSWSTYGGDEAKRRRLRGIAFHEASHAVISALLDQKTLWIEIHRDGYAETVPETNIFRRLDEPFESRRRIVIAMAGSAGQCRFMGWDVHWTPEGGNDKTLVEEIAQAAGRSPDDFSVVNAILSKAEVWENVSRLADTLLRCERLEGSALDELLPTATPWYANWQLQASPAVSTASIFHSNFP